MAAKIPRMETEQPHLPGIDPKDNQWRTDLCPMPTNYTESVDFLRQYCSTTVEWKEDHDILKVKLKVKDENEDVKTASATLEVEPGSLGFSKNRIVKETQELWAFRHFVLKGRRLLDGIPEKERSVVPGAQ